MSPRIGLAGLVLFSAIAPGEVCVAKPSDLPGDVTQPCREGRDRPLCDDGESRQPAVTARNTHDQRVERSLGDRAASTIGRSREVAGSAEEQEAPPTRQQFRETNDTQGTGNASPSRRSQQRELPTEIDERRMEMLRSTQPLGTIPQRPVDEGGIGQDDDFEQVQNFEGAPKVIVPLPPGHDESLPEFRRMPRADEIAHSSTREIAGTKNFSTADGSNNTTTGRAHDGKNYSLSCERQFGSGINASPWGEWTSLGRCGVPVFAGSPPLEISVEKREFPNDDWVSASRSGDLFNSFYSTMDYALGLKDYSMGHLVFSGMVRVQNHEESVTVISGYPENSQVVAIRLPLLDCTHGVRNSMLGLHCLILLHAPELGFVDQDGPIQHDGPFRRFDIGHNGLLR